MVYLHLGILLLCSFVVSAQISISDLGRKRYDCPLCDSSVFSYCSDKLLHDACCCLNPYELPYQCKYADCSFLHANTCREHKLITACCCNKVFFKYKCKC